MPTSVDRGMPSSGMPSGGMPSGGMPSGGMPSGGRPMTFTLTRNPVTNAFGVGPPKAMLIQSITRPIRIRSAAAAGLHTDGPDSESANQHRY